MDRTGPLKGVTLIEMAALGPVPLAGQLMADLGARVIVIDRQRDTKPADDINRRNKQTVAFNLKDPDARAVFMELVKSADALIEGFRPGVMEKLSIGPADCHKINERLIFGRMTGWGQDGPLSKTAGHDINYLAITGALHAIGRKDQPPVPPLNLVADYGGGAMFLVMGVLAALQERSTSGKGQVIDAAMIDGVPSLMGLIQTLYRQKQWLPERESNMLDGGAPYYRCYETADHKYLAVGAIEPQFFEEFINKAGLPLGDLKCQNDRSEWPAMHKRYELHFMQKSRDDWMRIFDGSDACVAPVLNFDEAPLHPHNAARGVFIDEEFQASPAPRFDRTPAQRPTMPLSAGESTDEILGELGISGEDISKLRKQGAIK